MTDQLIEGSVKPARKEVEERVLAYLKGNVDRPVSNTEIQEMLQLTSSFTSRALRAIMKEFPEHLELVNRNNARWHSQPRVLEPEVPAAAQRGFDLGPVAGEVLGFGNGTARLRLEGYAGEFILSRPCE